MMELAGIAHSVIHENLYVMGAFSPSPSSLLKSGYFFFIFGFVRHQLQTQCKMLRLINTQLLIFTNGCVKFVHHLTRAPQIVLGDQGVVVHVNESLFRHKPKVYKKNNK